MMRTRFDWVCLLAAFLTATGDVVSAETPAEREKTLAELPSLSDANLSERLAEVLPPDNVHRRFEYQALLTEVVRRGGAHWEEILQEHVDELMHRRVDGPARDETTPGTYYNLELLTALRRLQGKPDPLLIEIPRESDEEPLTADGLSLPRLTVAIRNVDMDKHEVGFRFGGNYRSGRQARWRVDVSNKSGRRIPRKRGALGFTIRGGQYQEGVLKAGDAWETTLDLRQFLQHPPPGEYTLQVLYHNSETIYFENDLIGLVFSRSDPIRFVVKPAVIRLTREQQRMAEEWIAALNAGQPLKIVCGTYGEWAHGFVAPESIPGKLMSLGPAAVPAIVNAVGDETHSVEKRAWLLSILHTATGLHDPRLTRALGSYSCIEGAWEVWGSRPGEGKWGGFAFPSEWSVSGGSIQLDAQAELVRKWTDWLKTADVQIVQAD